VVLVESLADQDEVKPRLSSSDDIIINSVSGLPSAWWSESNFNVLSAKYNNKLHIEVTAFLQRFKGRY